MLAILGTIISSVLGGGATGLLGVFVQRFFDMKNKSQDIDIIKLNHSNAIDLKRVDMEAAKDKYEANKNIAVVEANSREAVALEERLAKEFDAEQKSVQESMRTDKSSYYTGPSTGFIGFLLGIVDFIRGLVRPLLTAYLVGLLTYVFWWTQGVVAKMGVQQFTQAEAKDLVMQITGAVIYLATVSVVWWFGTRPPKKSGDN
jgi:hypothetical protein